MRHAAIIKVVVLHAYYKDQRCPDFTMEPHPETERLLRNHRCLLRACSNGVQIFAPFEGTAAFLPLPADAVLRFSLTLNNPDLALFTDLSALNALSAPVFRNAGAAAGAATELRLTQGQGGAARRRPGIFAEIEVSLVGRPAGDQLVTYAASLQAKQARWAYYCITDHAPGGALQIRDASPAGTSDVLAFSDANRTLLDEAPDPADPIAEQLASRYPTMRRVRIRSDQAIPCRQEPRRYLELRLDDERLTGPLPNPSLRSEAQEGVLYQIIKYRTQPFQTP